MIDGTETETPDGTPFMHGGDFITPMSRTFIPSRVSDNPYLMGTGYMTTLQSLPEPLRAQMLYGDFNAGVEDDPWQVIPSAWVEAAQARWKRPEQFATMDALGFDSLDAIGLMVELDTTFRVELPDYDPEKGGAMTPRSIAADVDRLVAENAGKPDMVPPPMMNNPCLEKPPTDPQQRRAWENECR